MSAGSDRAAYMAENHKRWRDGRELLAWDEWQALTRSQSRRVRGDTLISPTRLRAADHPPAPAVARPSAPPAVVPDPRTDVARHEAAHLVAGHLVGRLATEVDIEGTRHPGVAGHVESKGGTANPFGEVVEIVAGFVLDMLAGPSGEAIDRAFHGAESDLARASEAAARIEPANPDRIVRQAQGFANELLYRHWAGVERLAGRLSAARRMEGAAVGDEIEAALEGVDPVTWIVARRAALDAAGSDPAAQAAAWETASRRWYGSAGHQSRELYGAMWAGTREREHAEMLARREELERRAAAERSA